MIVMPVCIVILMLRQLLFGTLLRVLRCFLHLWDLLLSRLAPLKAIPCQLAFKRFVAMLIITCNEMVNERNVLISIKRRLGRHYTSTPWKSACIEDQACTESVSERLLHCSNRQVLWVLEDDWEASWWVTFHDTLPPPCLWIDNYGLKRVKLYGVWWPMPLRLDKGSIDRNKCGKHWRGRYLSCHHPSCGQMRLPNLLAIASAVRINIYTMERLQKLRINVYQWNQ
jgi:hypothetical protein